MKSEKTAREKIKVNSLFIFMPCLIFTKLANFKIKNQLVLNLTKKYYGHCYYILILLLFIVQPFISATQNLVKNGSFEEHKDTNKIKFGSILDWGGCAYCRSGQYPSQISNWENEGWWAPLWDDRYSVESNEPKLENTPVNNIRPYDGHTMIAMSYAPNLHRYGLATHLTARLFEPVEVGNLYEVKFWLYIDEPLRFQDPDWANHIGIALLPAHLDLRGIGKTTRHISSLFIDTVIYNKWYEVKWKIRPLCNNQFLTIGVFADPDWPINTGYKRAYFYIDNVSVVKRPWAVSEKNDTTFYYCSKYDPADSLSPKEFFKDKYLYFASNSFELSNRNKILLDSIAQFLRSSRTGRCCMNG